MDFSVIVPGQTQDDVRYFEQYRDRLQDHQYLPVIEPDLSLSEARNRGARDATGDVLVFTDGDCRPSSGWLDALESGYQDGTVAVGGPAYPHFQSNPTLLPDDHHWLVGCGPYLDDQQWVRNSYGCNFSIRRAVFQELGGFNPGLGKGSSVPHGEETEFAQRLYRERGERMLFIPEAYVLHRVDKRQLTVRALLERAYNQGQTKAVLGRAGEESQAIQSLLRGGPWQWALLGAAGLGWLRTRLQKPELEPSADDQQGVGL